VGRSSGARTRDRNKCHFCVARDKPAWERASKSHLSRARNGASVPKSPSPFGTRAARSRIFLEQYKTEITFRRGRAPGDDLISEAVTCTFPPYFFFSLSFSLSFFFFSFSLSLSLSLFFPFFSFFLPPFSPASFRAPRWRAGRWFFFLFFPFLSSRSGASFESDYRGFTLRLEISLGNVPSRCVARGKGIIR